MDAVVDGDDDVDILKWFIFILLASACLDHYSISSRGTLLSMCLCCVCVMLCCGYCYIQREVHGNCNR